MVLNESPQSGRRMEWMDLLRGSAVLLVVVWHVVAVPAMYEGSEPSGIVGAFNNALSPFRIPTLLVLSGLLLERSLSKGTKRYVTGKVRHIAWPYALWCVLITAASGSLTGLISPWFWLGGNILWYLAVLLFCYAAALLRPRWLPWGVCVVAPLVLLWVVEPSTNAVNRFLWFGAFFFLGVTLSRHLGQLQQRLPGWGAALLGVFALGGGAAVVLGHVTQQTPVFFMVSAVGILAVLWCAPRVPRTGLTKVLEWYGRHSIVVYVGHALAMFGTMRVLEAVGAAGSVVTIPLMVVGGFGAPTLLILVRDRIPWLFVFPEIRAVRSSASDVEVKHA